MKNKILDGNEFKQDDSIFDSEQVALLKISTSILPIQFLVRQDTYMIRS